MMGGGVSVAVFSVLNSAGSLLFSSEEQGSGVKDITGKATREKKTFFS